VYEGADGCVGERDRGPCAGKSPALFGLTETIGITGRIEGVFSGSIR
jgi:hypothetical protein